MGWLFWVVLVFVIAVAVSNSIKNQNSNNEKLGVKPGARAHRTIGLNYLGGHPRRPVPISNCILVVTSDHVAIEKGAQLPLKVPMNRVEGLTVETEAEAKRRITATRMVAFGVFSLAIPKKTAGSVLVTIDTDEGPIVLEKLKADKPAVLRSLGPSIALVNASRRKPAAAPDLPAPAAKPAPHLSMADELGKLADLMDRGHLTPEEFSEQKAALLGRSSTEGPKAEQGVPHPGTSTDPVEVVLVDCGPKKINVIKVIRELTLLSLKEAKALTDEPGGVVLTAERSEAEDAVRRLELAEARCEIRTV